MYAIAGVSGNTGSVVAEELLRRGEKIRVIVRNEEKGAPWREKGAEVAVASMDDADALTRALTGVEGAYLLLPPDMGSDDMIARGRAFGDAFAQAVRAAGVKHVVFLSSIGAQHATGTGPIRALHEIETRLRGTGAALTLLRPPYFIENWGAAIGPASSDGVLPTFITPSLKIDMVATRDIGVAAADALRNVPSGVRIVELAGPGQYDASDVASALGSALGKDLQVVHPPLDAVVPTFTSFGISEHVAGLFREMYEGINSGHVAWDGTGERLQGTTPPEAVFRGLLSASQQ
jgi:uncharacterized protein YbjT (DUF2867 family)